MGDLESTGDADSPIISGNELKVQTLRTVERHLGGIHASAFL